MLKSKLERISAYILSFGIVTLFITFIVMIVGFFVSNATFQIIRTIIAAISTAICTLGLILDVVCYMIFERNRISYDIEEDIAFFEKKLIGIQGVILGVSVIFLLIAIFL